MVLSLLFAHFVRKSTTLFSHGECFQNNLLLSGLENSDARHSLPDVALKLRTENREDCP